VRILVTGVNGFLGAHVAAQALASGLKVWGLDLRQDARAARLRASLQGPGVGTPGEPILRVSDMDSPSALQALLQEFQPAAVLHLAADLRRRVEPALEAQVFENNLRPALALFDAVARLPQAQRPVVVMPGSQMEYGDLPGPWTEDRSGSPSDPYARGKVAATLALQQRQAAGELRGCVLRLPLVFGPGQAPVMFIPQLLVALLQDQDFPMSAGTQRRRFVEVGEVASLLLELARRLVAGEALPPVLNCPASEPLSIGEVADRLVALVPGARASALKRGALGPIPPEPPQPWPDTTLAQQLGLGGTQDLDRGLALTARWYRENPWFWEAAGGPAR
jgi:nucleoside-diphosphate-sugar epimerase